jgi:methylmalonyl-CoA/ethylmalonyl-CoA epimerase
MIIDHICFAVRNIVEGVEYWQAVFGYRQTTCITENTRQKVKVVFLSKKGSLLVKLIEPFSENLSLMNFVKRGGCFHHVCFRCSNLEKDLQGLVDKGLITLVPPEPGEAFNNRNIAFLLSSDGLIIELIDTDEKAGLL